MLELVIALNRVCNADKVLASVKLDCISNGHRLRKYIDALTKRCKGLSKDINIVIFSEFRDSFLSYSSFTAKDRLILHAFTL